MMKNINCGRFQHNGRYLYFITERKEKEEGEKKQNSYNSSPTTEGGQEKDKERPAFQYIALFPNDIFATLHATPRIMADKLHSLGTELRDDWNKLNLDPNMQGKRVALEKPFPMFRNNNIPRRGTKRLDRAAMVLTITSWHHNQKNMDSVDPDPITLEDLMVLILRIVIHTT